MTDQGSPLRPEHVFKRVTWRSMLSVGAALEQSTTWTITGVAAIVGLFISNLDSASKIIGLGGIRWSVILFASSLLAAAISKQIGMALQSGLRTVTELESLLSSEQGKTLLSAMALDPHQLTTDIAEPFLWPLSWLMRRAGERGTRDYLAGDKRLVRMFCLQLYFSMAHSLLAVVALIVLAVSIKLS